MEPFDPDEFAKLVDARIREVTPGLRKYAGFWEWPDKQLKELGIARDLHRALEERGDEFYRDPSSNPHDPPDVLAFSRTGGQIGLEMCELVSQRAIEVNQRATDETQRVYWHPDLADVVAEIRRIIDLKDGKVFKGGPYEELVLTIHTDELAVDRTALETALQGHVIPRPRQLTRGYLLFSYDPHIDGYPVIALRFPE